MTIHQTLHGYNQGHNLLFSSVNLPYEDEDYMKIQSDWTEYANNGEDDSSYIKTYPLPLSQCYVIAKSWYAYEMSRPGCVWTHSLIINLEDIDIKFDFRSLYGLFKRPTDGLTGYDKPIEVNCPDSGVENVLSSSFSEKSLAYLYHGLLTPQYCTYLVEDKSCTYQYLLLSLLEYLPIEVVKNTKMCSGISSMTGDITYNLSFSPSSRLRLENAADASILAGGENYDGIVYLAKAIHQQENMVAQLVRTFSEDLRDDIIKIDTFGKLIEYLDKPSGIEFHTLLELIVKAFPNQEEGKKIKKSFISQKIITVFSSMDSFFEDVCVNEYKDAIQIETLFPYSSVDEYFQKDFNKLQELLGNIVGSDTISQYGKGFLTYEVRQLSVDWQKELFERNWTLYQSLLNFDPEWLYNSYWLDASPSKFESLLPVFDKLDLARFKDWSKLLNRLLTSGLQISNRLSNGFLENYPEGTSDCLEYIQTGQTANCLCYILCEYNIPQVIKWVNSHTSISYETVDFISQIVNPTSIEAKQGGSLLWYNMLYSIKRMDNARLCIFFYQLSFNWADKYSLSMLKQSFWKLYCLFAESKLNNNSITLLASYLVEVAPWHWWDNCKKFRKGLVRSMKRSGYRRSDLYGFTPAEDLNEKLLKSWDKL